MQSAEIVETSIYRMMRVMLEETHDERGISVLSGPPGIGKTTTLDAFAGDYDAQCLVVKAMANSHSMGMTPVAVLQAIIDGFWRQWNIPQYYALRPSVPHLTRDIRKILTYAYGPDDVEHGRLTVIFDEAQYLSRAAIEMLRYWNDPDRTTMPFQIGLVFVGNNEFALASSNGSASILSDAVRDRLLYSEQLGHTNLSDDDMAKVAATRGLADLAAVKAILAYLSAARIKRSLRQLDRVIVKCARFADGAPITAQLVNDILNPQ